MLTLGIALLLASVALRGVEKRCERIGEAQPRQTVNVVVDKMLVIGNGEHR